MRKIHFFLCSIFLVSFVAAVSAQTQDTVYVLDRGNFLIYVIDPNTNSVTAMVTQNGASPFLSISGIAFTPDLLTGYVTDRSNGTIYVFNTTANASKNNQVTNVIVDSAAAPAGIQVTPNGKSAYVAVGRFGRVDVIDTKTNMVIGQVIPGNFPDIGNPFDVAITPDGSTVYISCGAGSLIFVGDTKTNQIINTIDSGPFLGFFDMRNIVITPDGATVYTGSFGSGLVYAIDTKTQKTIAAITPPVVGSILGLQVTPDGKNLYIADQGNVYVLDTATNTITGSIFVNTKKFPPFAAAFSIGFLSDGLTAYISDTNNALVYVVDTTTLSVTATVSTAGFSAFINPEKLGVLQFGVPIPTRSLGITGTVAQTQVATNQTINVATQQTTMNVNQTQAVGITGVPNTPASNTAPVYVINATDPVTRTVKIQPTWTCH